jgi:acyl-CoA thioester hydrolase
MSKLDITYRGSVHQWHCDHMGHMNVMWYVCKFDEATWNLAAMMGLTSDYLKRKNRGMAAVEQRICYRKEALAGDVITIRTAIVEVRPKLVRFVHEMRRGDQGDWLATMLATGVHIDTVVRKSVEFEPEVLALSAKGVAADPTAWDAWPPARTYIE